MQNDSDRKKFMASLLPVAKKLFFAGEEPSALGMPVIDDIHVDSGGGLDGQQHINSKDQVQVQISKLLADVGAQMPIVVKFAIAHEFAHVCAGNIGEQIGTAGLDLSSNKHEVAADLIGAVLMLNAGISQDDIKDAVGPDKGTWIMDDREIGTHPARKDRAAYIAQLFKKLDDKVDPIEAVKEVLAAMPQAVTQ